jgi:hypothetical protein
LNGARRSLGLMERPSASSCQGWTIASIGLSLIARRILTNLNRPPQWGASCKTVEVLPAPLGAAHAMRRFASRLVARVKGMHSPPCWSCLLGPCVEEQGGLSPAFAQSIRWPVLAGDVA